MIHCGGPIDRCYGPRVSPITTVNLQLSWRWRNYQRFIPSFKVFGHLSFLIKTTFHNFVTFISIYCIGINRAYMYLTHIRTFAGKSPCMFIFFLFNKLSLLTVTLYLWKNFTLFRASLNKNCTHLNKNAVWKPDNIMIVSSLHSVHHFASPDHMTHEAKGQWIHWRIPYEVFFYHDITTESKVLCPVAPARKTSS